MQEQTYKRARIKILSIGLLLGLAFVCASVYLAYRHMGEVRSQRQRQLKQMVEVARNTIEPVLAEYRSRKISKDEAVERVRDLVRRMVYTDHSGQNYLFMAAYDGTLLVHPIDPGIEMTNQLDYVDSRGVRFGKSLIDAATSEAGQGFVSYHYYTPGGSSTQKKTTFVMGIPQLQCYIATGQYMDDIQRNQIFYIVSVAGLSSVLLILLISLVWAFMKQIRAQNSTLIKTERELMAIFNNAVQFVGALSPEGIVMKANRTALNVIGREEADVVGKPFWETPWWPDGEEKERLKIAIRDCSEGKTCRFETIHKIENQGTIHVDFHLSPVLDEKGAVSSMLAEGRDITEIVQAKNEIIREKMFFDYVIESLPGVFFLYKRKGEKYVLEKWNHSQHDKILGYSPDELRGADLLSFFTDKDLPVLNNALKQIIEKGTVYLQADTVTKENGVVPMLYSAQHFEHDGDEYIVGTGLELTEKLKAEEEKKKLEYMLLQSQKMEAMGSLAGGIAHDFNNILSAILGYAEMVGEDLPPLSPSKKMQDQVVKAALRAKSLVRQILLFSRQSAIEMKPVLMRLVVSETVKLLRSSIPTTIEIKQHIPNDTGAILADATQLHQIVMNLCTNAYHAMRETGGTLSVRLTERDVAKEAFMYSGSSLTPGRYLLLEVSDTGHGMDRATREKIFDPYFTTKKKGEGTGLGLSVVHGIVKTCGGEIKVCSEPGQGTSVHVYFPKIEDEVQDEAAQNKAAFQKGSERVLLVDDDAMNITMMKESLTNLGYQVSAFSSSQEALDAFFADPDGFDLVVTDMTMPKITGMDLSKNILGTRPQMPIVLCTGYSELITKEKTQAIGIKAFMLKPVLREDLAKTIREVLGAETSSR